jgi:hypothetical protein
MLNKSMFSILSVLILITAMGCSESIKDELGDLIESAAKAECKKEFECCGQSTMSRHYSTEEECVDYLLKANAGDYVKVEWTTLKWNDENVAECKRLISEVFNYDCAGTVTLDHNRTVSRMNEVCADVLEGTLGVGKKCHKHSYCEKGLFCSGNPGVCTKYALRDEPCSKKGVLCDPDRNLYCSPENTCQLLPGLNGDCSYSGACYKDARNLFCEEGERKVKDDNNKDVTITIYRCRKLPEAGSKCLDNKCDESAYCSTEKEDDETVKICRAKKGHNEECSQDSQCLSGFCDLPYIEEVEDDDTEKEPVKITAKCLGTFKDMVCNEYEYYDWD